MPDATTGSTTGDLTLTWTPAPSTWPALDADALIVSQEHLTQIAERITVARENEEAQQPESLAWSMPDGAPDHITITQSKDGSTLLLDVLIADWIGLFSIEIEFMRAGQVPQQVSEWDAVPAPEVDVYAYRASSENVRRFRLVVQALTAQGEVIETATYTITVYANYTIGRNALKDAVQQRKENVK